MVRKVLVGIFIVGITSALAYGAWNRTAAKVEPSESSTLQQRGAGSGRGNHSEKAEAVDVSIPRSNAGGQGGGQGGQGGGQGGQGGGQSGQSGRSAGQGQGQAPKEAPEWETTAGVVSAVSDSGLTVRLANGEEILVEGRTWMFIRDNGFAVGIEDGVQLRGYDEDGEFKLVEIENLLTAEVLSIREASGRPLWAGGGRQNS